MADIAVDPFTWSSTAGNNQPTGSTVIGTGLDDNFRAVQAGAKSVFEPLSGVAGTNTITGTHATLTAYASSFFCRFIPANTNTGATTLNVNSLGAKNVFLNNAALVGGELTQNVPVLVHYDGTQFQIVGPNQPATQTQQETSTQTNVYVSPGRQHYHPSAAKAWINCGVTGNILASYNVTSVTDTGTGLATINYTTSFSSSNYAAVVSIQSANEYIVNYTATGTPASSVLVRVWTTAGSFVDPVAYSAAMFGDQ